jgi:histone chaperone ASF1
MGQLARFKTTPNPKKHLHFPSASFRATTPFQITFEAHSRLEADLDWSVTYVGSAQGPAHDQVLDTVSVGPIEAGTSRFVLETPGPDPSRIPQDDMLGTTICMVSCLYRDQKFFQAGYWVANTYADPLEVGENGAEIRPTPILPEKVVRQLVDPPRITRWPIRWD